MKLLLLTQMEVRCFPERFIGGALLSLGGFVEFSEQFVG